MTCKHSLTPGVSADGDRAPPAGRMTRREFVSHATTVALGMSASSTAAGGGNAARVQAGVSPIVLMSAIELANAIRSRTLSCTEVMSAYLDHIGRLNPKVNAIVSLQDRSDLLQQASTRDAQLAKGQYLGWMHGLPHAVKDLADTAGIRTTHGSPLLDAVPAHDTIMVERIRKRARSSSARPTHRSSDSDRRPTTPCLGPLSTPTIRAELQAAAAAARPCHSRYACCRWRTAAT